MDGLALRLTCLALNGQSQPTEVHLGLIGLVEL
jgi:hypothetical protein